MVQRTESTPGPELGIIRQYRKANPQYFFSSSPYSHQVLLPPQQPDSVVQSAFGRGYPSAEIPFVHQYVSDPRAAFRFGFHITVTVTSTLTVLYANMTFSLDHLLTPIPSTYNCRPLGSRQTPLPRIAVPQEHLPSAQRGIQQQPNNEWINSYL